jgi:hypothetical protein
MVNGWRAPNSPSLPLAQHHGHCPATVEAMAINDVEALPRPSTSDSGW